MEKYFLSEFSLNQKVIAIKTSQNIMKSMNMYGKNNFPRLTAWYGNNDKSYSFSGITLQPLPWTNEILIIKNKIDLIAKTEFNSVLLNLYRDGNDYINFDATRMFQLRHIKTKEKLEIELTHGSLLIMQGELQHFWQHQVPKTNKTVGERINLTFRVII